MQTIIFKHLYLWHDMHFTCTSVKFAPPSSSAVAACLWSTKGGRASFPYVLAAWEVKAHLTLDLHSLVNFVRIGFRREAVGD